MGHKIIHVLLIQQKFGTICKGLTTTHLRSLSNQPLYTVPLHYFHVALQIHVFSAHGKNNLHHKISNFLHFLHQEILQS